MSRGSRCILTFINGVVTPEMVREQREIQMKKCNCSDGTCHSIDTDSDFWLKCRLLPFSISSGDFPTVNSKYQRDLQQVKMCQESTELSRTGRDIFNFVLLFQLHFAEWINNKNKEMQLRSMQLLCGENRIFWDWYFFKWLNGFLDDSNGLII